jgi:transcriptional regulator
MYTPKVFLEEDRDQIIAMIRACSLATMVTHSSQQFLATSLPMYLAESEGKHGVLHAHIAKANPQWQETSKNDALVIFQGPNAYITPNWYPSKQQNGMVVPTWNYIAVHAYGSVEFYDDPKRLLEVVSTLTNLYEAKQPKPWSVDDAPRDYIEAQLRGIIGVRIQIERIEAKKKLSQNRSAKNRTGAKAGLQESPFEGDAEIADMIPQ